jgi:hypothetical protein
MSRSPISLVPVICAALTLSAHSAAGAVIPYTELFDDDPVGDIAGNPSPGSPVAAPSEGSPENGTMTFDAEDPDTFDLWTARTVAADGGDELSTSQQLRLSADITRQTGDTFFLMQEANLEFTGLAGNDFTLSFDFEIENFDDEGQNNGALSLGVDLLDSAADATSFGYRVEWRPTASFWDDGDLVVYGGDGDERPFNQSSDTLPFVLDQAYTMTIQGDYDTDGTLKLNATVSDGVNQIVENYSDPTPYSGAYVGLFSRTADNGNNGPSTLSDVDFDNFSLAFGSTDLFIPEPGSITLMLMGMVSIMMRGRVRHS